MSEYYAYAYGPFGGLLHAGREPVDLSTDSFLVIPRPNDFAVTPHVLVLLAGTMGGQNESSVKIEGNLYAMSASDVLLKIKEATGELLTHIVLIPMEHHVGMQYAAQMVRNIGNSEPIALGAALSGFNELARSLAVRVIELDGIPS
jgi:glutamine cyclotransferase